MILEGRPCGSATRKPGRWTRKQIDEIAKKKGLENISRKTMDVLCRELSEITHQKIIDIQGCKSVTQYNYISRNSVGHIVLIGENHTYKGNTPDLLRQLLNQTECAVDICIEKNYYIQDVEFRHNVISLTKYFIIPPISKCSTKGRVVKQDKIKDSTPDFWKDCIKPYQGRVKIWSTDFRYSGFFEFLNHSDPDEVSRGLKTKLFEKILMYDAYKKDKDAYNQMVKDHYQRYLESRWSAMYVPVFLRLFNQGKDHMRLMHDLDFLPIKVIREWLRMIKISLCENFSVCGLKHFPARAEGFEPMFGIMDLYTAMRIIRLAQQEENRIILFFGGYLHQQLIDKLLTAYLNNTNPSLLYHRRTTDCGDDDHKKKLVLPDIPCNKKTLRMIAYQSRQQHTK